MIATLIALATIAATPAQLPAILATAKAGDTIKLTGPYPTITIKGRTFSRRLNIDAKRATIAGVVIDGTRGVTWRGGIITGGPIGYAVRIKQASQVSFYDATITKAVRGVVIDQSSDVVIARNLLTALQSDGIDVSGQRIQITGNICREFAPKPGDHPDCVQGSSTDVPTADVTVTGNRAEGLMQGFFFRADLPGSPGFDRIVIERNYANIAYSNGFVIAGGRNSRVRWNEGTRWTGWAGKVNARITGSGMVCGNILPDVPKAAATSAC